ncbi:MAG: hypothetical protein Q8P06_01650 [Candidatus Azambacteria bacterium]|nr:hypothetical protein [Candidatus Azambacteria bacterium]
MVEINPQKPKIVLPEWHWPLRMTAILFFLSVIAFMSLKVYLSQIQEEIISVNGQIKIEASKVSPDDELSIIHLKDSLKAFKSLVSNHSYFSGVLDTIGSLTYQKLTFTKFDANRKDNLIQLKGSTQNYTALAKQMVALRENKNVKSLEVRGINFGDRGLEFELSMIVDPQLFINNNE